MAIQPSPSALGSTKNAGTTETGDHAAAYAVVVAADSRRMPVPGVGLRDAPLLGLDLFSVKWIVYPGQECRRNLSRLRDVAQAWRDHAEPFPPWISSHLRPNAGSYSRWKTRPSRASIAPHKPIDAYWHQPVPRTSDPQAPFVINPHLFTRPSSEWRDSDVVAADSRPRHIAATEGPGIWSVFLIRWDRSIQQAYFRGDQSPTLIQHLNDFAAGSDRRDADDAWSPYYDRPTLDLTTGYLRVAGHLAVALALTVVWVRLYRHNTLLSD